MRRRGTVAEVARRRRARDRTKPHRDAVRKVSTLHGKVQRQRRDQHHKTALALMRAHDVIAVEDLKIAGMTRAPEPKPDSEQANAYLPNQTAAKAGLNKSILDAGWGQFRGILAGAGRRVIPVDARNTARTCPTCGHTAKENRVSQTAFVWLRCGYSGNADVVGAANIAFRAEIALRSVAKCHRYGNPAALAVGGVTVMVD